MPPKVVNASTIMIVACHCSWRYHLKYIANVHKPLSTGDKMPVNEMSRSTKAKGSFKLTKFVGKTFGDSDSHNTDGIFCI